MSISNRALGYKTELWVL